MMRVGVFAILLFCSSVQGNCPRCPVLGLSGTLMAANREAPGTGTFIDLATGDIFAVVEVGDTPHEMAARGELAVWVAFDGNVITVVHIPTRNILHSIDTFPQQGCHGIQFLDDNYVMVGCSGLGVDPRGVIIVDVRNGVIVQTIDTSPVSPHQLSRAPNDNTTVFLANIFGNTLGRVDLIRGVQTGVIEIPSVAPDGGFEGIGVTLDGSKIWLAQSHPIGAPDPRIAIVDVRTFSFEESFLTGGTSAPIRAEHTHAGVTLVSHLHAPPALQFYNTSTRSVIAQIDFVDDDATIEPLSVTIWFIFRERYALMSCSALNKIVIIDLESYQIVADIFDVATPDGLAWVPETYYKH